MKKAFLRMSIMLALASLAAAQFVRAQELMVAKIPFAFTAGKMVFPAGEYKIEKRGGDSSLLLIRQTDGDGVGFVQSNAAEHSSAQTETKLTFHRYDKRYFLSQVWVAGSSRGRELPKSAEEKELGLAASKAKPEEITVVARLTAPKR